MKPNASHNHNNHWDGSPYIAFGRDEWAALRAETPLTLSPDDLRELRGVNEHVLMEEVVEIYLPLSRLLNLHIGAKQELFRATATFLGHLSVKVPFVIAMVGSVAAGKSTMARVLQALLRRWPNTPKVDLVTTDGFLFPNAVLEERGLMERKGFPESYDREAMIQFLHRVKSGVPRVTAPVYSHFAYDILPDETVEVDRPDILIIEGLNLLQTSTDPIAKARIFASDFFDFSIHVDAQVPALKSWYVDRFLTLRDTTFRDANSYFHRYAAARDDEARVIASGIWDRINGRNLEENIRPTRTRADLILQKSEDHSISRVLLKKI